VVDGKSLAGFGVLQVVLRIKIFDEAIDPPRLCRTTTGDDSEPKLGYVAPGYV
jgi:hypothetical protein